MIITDEKITVTLEMLEAENMTRGENEIGVPKDPNDQSRGFTWKTFDDLSEADFDTLETYFLNKQ